ncbi:PDZ and LIM domain protein 7-like isoform X2 [Ruditapes philippinarum]|uniref:PDZ and LIM domain protein 7-like isoform X2 n=1 Tax=Ruditapes philippinarum TaxID=129788 RepID=UPI00295AE0C8|nr:PDZ and LIM domain protein 7-like isoform X2 [Ruditapes philippinarum]
MSILTLEAKLERQESTTPWGFRMQGGKDFSSPITIARVTPGSLAAKCGLQQGDIILKIGSKASETLKHKDAQDAILSYGNKLDLLLQRFDYHHSHSGGTQNAQTYDKFSTPTIGSYQSPAAPSSAPGTQSYNTAPKPFGAAPAPTKAPAPYSAPQIDVVTHQTQNLNINPTNYSKYADVEDKTGPGSHQSRSFKFLQDTLDSGQDPPAALRPTVDLRRSPSPNAGVNKQFNSPMGLYSGANIQKQQTLTTNVKESNEGTNGEQDEGNKFDAQGKLLYRPSETFKLIREQENKEETQEKPVEVKQTRTIRQLEKQLGESNNVEDTDASGKSPRNFGESEIQYPSETFQLVRERELRPYQAVLRSPEQSGSFKELERQLCDKPASQPARAPAAPKPGVWTPGQGGGSAPPAKPFTPSVAPPPQAPPAPRGGAPPKPTGVGAVRGKLGDAVVKTGDGGRVPVCASCGAPIRGPFVVAMGKSWCPDHFICANPRCGEKLIDIGFVEENGFLYCEKDYELYFAPHCAKCEAAIIGECVNALNKQYHPACFLCFQCKQPIGGTQFHLEDGNPYCENDWRQLYQTMCSSCNFPIEPGDKWVEALGNNYHSECFNCSTCQVNLEGQAFYAKSGKPYCKKHAR